MNNLLNNLYTNGCSFTYGNTLKENGKKTWPMLLSEKLNLNLIDDSYNRKSIESIHYTTINSLHKLDKNTKVVIGCTWSPRYMIQCNDKIFDIQPNSKSQYVEEPYDKPVNKFVEYYQSLLKYDDKRHENEKKQMITLISSLQGFLEFKGFDYRIIIFHGQVDLNSSSRLPITDVLNMNNIIDLTDKEFHYNITDKKTSHPTEEGCKKISEIIYDSFNR